MNREHAINLDSDDDVIQTSPNKSKGKAQECIDLTLDDTDEEQEVQSKQQERTAMPSTTPSVSASPDRDQTLKQQSPSTSRILSTDSRARKSTVEDDERVEQQMISDSQPEEDQIEEENLGADEQDDPCECSLIMSGTFRRLDGHSSLEKTGCMPHFRSIEDQPQPREGH